MCVGRLLALRAGLACNDSEATNIYFINAESVIGDLVISSGEGSFDEDQMFQDWDETVEANCARAKQPLS